MVSACKSAGVEIFIIHARKAWLEGLSPRQNRDRPPLDYQLVYAIKRENPELTIVLNGGITTMEACEEHLKHVDGVMLGRAAYQNPELLTEVDARLFGGAPCNIEAVLEKYLVYVEGQLAKGVHLHAMTRHMLGLFAGVPGSRAFRRHISENAPRPNAGIEVLRDALKFVMNMRMANSE
jgi:tRNA-dihydrouridine synthase A